MSDHVEPMPKCFVCGNQADSTMTTDSCLDCPEPGLTVDVCDACEVSHQDGIYFAGWA